MWVYHWFAKNRSWTPEKTRSLTLAEQFWLPVLDDAEQIAASRLADK